ncbi:Agamous-like MADS-box protein [Nymphaea thermarum]|nr:Agamous-like MADS-box protein [Nymphaea thermarum]
MAKNNGNKGAGRSRMGRQKIEIKKIMNEEARQVCFSKRRNGLIKKAGELCILCGAEVAIIVFSPAGKAFSYGDPSVDAVINRFLDPSTHVPSPPDAHRACTIQELNSQHDTLVQQIEAEKKRHVELQKQHQSEGVSRVGSYWDADVENLSPDQLQEFMAALEEMRSALANRAEELMMGMAMMHLPASAAHHHPQFPPQSVPLPPPFASNSSTTPLPFHSFLGSHNTNSMTIPFTNSNSPFMGSSDPHGTMANSSDYFIGNRTAGRPFYLL